MLYDRILVPTDLSPYSDRAVKEALEHLRPRGRLCLVHVAEPQYAVLGILESAAPVYDEALTQRQLLRAQRHLRALAAKLGPRAQFRVLRGIRPAALLAAEARRFKAQLVVLATHGRGGLNRLLFGSMAQKLLALYRGPVLMFRPGR
jgi:nucleotide-binding universal stress UspA family protein